MSNNGAAKGRKENCLISLLDRLFKQNCNQLFPDGVTNYRGGFALCPASRTEAVSKRATYSKAAVALRISAVIASSLSEWPASSTITSLDRGIALWRR